MEKRSLVSIVVPAYNEAESLAELFSRTKAALIDRPFEFIVVDDGSVDGTSEVIKNLRANNPNIALLRHFRNHGKSLALMQGFDEARGEVLVMLDADLQNEPELVPLFLAKIEEGYDLVNGWRQLRKDSWMRGLVSQCFNQLVSWTFRSSFRDINCGFKAMRRDLYTRLELRGDLHRLIQVIAQLQGYRVAEIPIHHCPRRYGRSKYGILRLNGLLDIVALIAQNATQLRPFESLVKVGLLMFIAGAVLLSAALVGVAGARSLSPVSLVIWGGAGIAGLWAVLTAPLVGLCGFVLDIMSAYAQDRNWRHKLLKEKLGSAKAASDLRP